MCWGDLGFAPAAMREEHTVVQALVAIRRPKIRTGVRHANIQYVTVECPMLAELVRWLCASLPAADRETRVFAGSSTDFLRYWRAALRAADLGESSALPAGLRGGGATHHWLVHQDVPRLRRRGRWASERTLEHYLHDVVYALRLAEANLESTKVAQLERLSAAFLSPPPTPAPPVCYRTPPLINGALSFARERSSTGPRAWPPKSGPTHDAP